MAKINSANGVAIAEVVRDLYRSEAQPEQSSILATVLASSMRSTAAISRAMRSR